MSEHHILFRDEIAKSSLLFNNPSQILTANTPAELDDVLQQVEAHRANGQWIAGYLSYEAGFCFEHKLQNIMPSDRLHNLARFGVFSPPQVDYALPSQDFDLDTYFSKPKPLWDFETYQEKFDQLTHHMRVGNCYQANLTFPMSSNWQGDSFELFMKLTEIQPVNHAAYVDLGGPIILSRSPELFFNVDSDGWIESRPMKGTAPRGRTTEEDEKIANMLQSDQKNLSENVMIVDLLRNDLSVICEAGSVHVPQLYELKTYTTLHQLVSKVRGKMVNGTTFYDIIRSIFPCGSITGVPKLRAMQILYELEGLRAREAYCGAIGWIAPSGEMQFNVPIRTISLYKNGHAQFNVGGGITLGSTAQSEYEECLTKARFATELANLYR